MIEQYEKWQEVWVRQDELTALCAHWSSPYHDADGVAAGVVPRTFDHIKTTIRQNPRTTSTVRARHSRSYGTAGTLAADERLVKG